MNIKSVSLSLSSGLLGPFGLHQARARGSSCGLLRHAGRTSFWDTLANARRCSHSTPNLACFPFPALPGFQKALSAREARRFLNKLAPHFAADGRFTSSSTGFCALPCFFLICLKPSKNVRVRSFAFWGSRGPLLRPRRKTQLYVVIDVRSVAGFVQNGPGTPEGCTFLKSLF